MIKLKKMINTCFFQILNQIIKINFKINCQPEKQLLIDLIKKINREKWYT